MIHRIAIANMTAKEISARGQADGFTGSAWDVLGFGPTWGEEPTVIFETTDNWPDVKDWIRKIMTERAEKAAYVVRDGRLAFLVYAKSGHVSMITAGQIT